MDKAVHDGHRQRMREKVEKNGIESLSPHEILEYLLFAYIPRKNTNDIAHALINRFGSFAGVLNADKDDLAEVGGMTDNAALFLSTLPDVFRSYSISACVPRERLSGRGAAEEFMRKHTFSRPVEEVIVAALDAQDNLLKVEKLASGWTDSVRIAVSDVVAFVMRTKAVSVLIAHNHPSGRCAPSRSDNLLTHEIVFALSAIGVNVQDHFIFSDTDRFSYEQSGRLGVMKKAFLKTFRETQSDDYEQCFAEDKAEQGNERESVVDNAECCAPDEIGCNVNNNGCNVNNNGCKVNDNGCNVNEIGFNIDDIGCNLDDGKNKQ